MRNRLCHELHLCHCTPGAWHKPPCQWGSHGNDRVSVKKRLILTYMCCLPCIQAKKKSGAGVYCLHLQKWSHLAQLGLHPSFLLRALSREDGARRDVLCRFHLEKKKNPVLSNKMARTAWGQAYRPHTAHYHLPDVMNSEWHSAIPLSK